MKLKKIISLALCGLMLICIIPLLSLSKASDDVVFLVVNNVVSRPLSASTMPIGVNKEVYVPYTTLAGLKTVGCTYDTLSQQLIFYSGSLRLIFDLANNRTYDEQCTRYDYSAIYLNDTVYIPLNTFCTRFDLYYSVTSYSLLAPMVRIHEGELVGSDIEFTSQLYSLLKTTYEDYVSSDHEPVAPAPYVPKQRAAYMIFYGDAAGFGSKLLSEAPGINGAFFLTADEIYAGGALVRQCISEGHAIGIMLDPQASEDLGEQYAAANNALRMSTGRVSRIVGIKGGISALSSDQLDELDRLNVRIWDIEDTASSLSSILNMASKSKTAPVIALPCTEQTVELIPRLLDGLEQLGYHTSPIYEWTAPINGLNIIK